MTENDEHGRPSGTGEDHPAERIEADHRVLRGRLEALEEAANHAGILSTLRELPKTLAEHFADEEAVGGLYDDLAMRCPPIADKIEVLRAEHRAFLDDLEALSREVQSHPGLDGPINETTMRSVARYVERLRRHERAEATMIADVYYNDEGGHG